MKTAFNSLRRPRPSPSASQHEEAVQRDLAKPLTEEHKEREPITVAIIGAGQRGTAYAEHALHNPDKCRVSVVAEPRLKTRQIMVAAHKIDPSLVFSSWKDFHKASKDCLKAVGRRLVDAVVVAVQDHLHAEVVLAFAEQGYHILCEKPMATTIEDCVRMTNAIKASKCIFAMGHVLRYSPYFSSVLEVIRSRVLGKLVNVQLIEPVGYYHFAHSYVRGNWSQEDRSSFSLMTKSCHDIDILCHWMSPERPSWISSFGSLSHFRKSEKPAEAGEALRCLDCKLVNSCPYSAKSIYLDPVKHGIYGWPVNTIIPDGLPDIENVTDALKRGPYGLCVYESDNDVVDHQVVNIQWSDGTTASHTMVAFTSAICERQLRLHFSHGELVGDNHTFTTTDFRTGKTTTHQPRDEGGGHGGGDTGLMRSFVEAVQLERQSILDTDVDEVLRSHLTVFAAEESRKSGSVIDCQVFEQRARQGVDP